MIAIPDNATLTTCTADGGISTFPASAIRKPFHRPELADVRLLIGLPIYAQVPTFFMQCLLNYIKHEPVKTEIHIAQGDGVARSRNALSAEFLRGDYTHLLFIDSDLVFSPDHIVRMLSHRVDLVGGFYPKKQDGKLEWVINTLPQPMPEPTVDGLQPVKYVGTGFMLIARAVFEQMIARYPEIEFVEDYGRRTKAHDFWSMGVYREKDGSGRYLSEDWYFCQRWLDMGKTVYADTGVVLKHIGPAIFPLSHQEPEIYNTPKPVVPCKKGHAATCNDLCGLSCQHEAADPQPQ